MKITAAPRIDLQVQFNVNEDEARALDALACYGDDAFIERFYETLGRSYMEPHEQGLRTFFKTIREQMPAILGRANTARKAFEGNANA